MDNPKIVRDSVMDKPYFGAIHHAMKLSER